MFALLNFRDSLGRVASFLPKKARKESNVPMIKSSLELTVLIYILSHSSLSLLLYSTVSASVVQCERHFEV